MNIKKYKKGENKKLSTHFRLKEYECKCNDCKETLVDLDHIISLELIRSVLNQPISITSAYRCPSHNKAIGGVTNSQHLLGTATDIQVKDATPKVVQSLADHIFNGLGKYDTFTHVDSRVTRARWDNTTKKGMLGDGPSIDAMDAILADLEDDLL